MLTSGRMVASTTAAVRWARVVEEGDGEEEGVVVLLVGSGPATPSGTMAAPFRRVISARRSPRIRRGITAATRPEGSKREGKGRPRTACSSDGLPRP